jgi:ABC-type multidrug transport system ATPase subunit
MEELLVADCVGKRYGDRWVLRSASLRAKRGEVRALLGRNGAGKSTLLKIGAGIVRAESGVVRFNAVPHERPGLSVLARQGLCFIPDHDLLSSAFSIREHFAFVRRHEPDAVERVTDRLCLRGLLDARPHQISSGERRRAEVAFALLRRPTCLLVDEPLRNLAPIDADLLLQVLREIARSGCAVVITGHEVPALLAAVDHVTWCTSGTTYELGPPFMARTDERFMRDYLGFAGR